MPCLALGTAQFGLAYGVSGRSTPVEPNETRKILEHARKCGISRLDTASAYGDIEERLSDLIIDLDFSVVSKIPFCNSVQELESHFTRSFKRLKPNLNGLLFHDSANLHGKLGEEMWRHARQLAIANKTSIGASYYDPRQLAADIERLGDLEMAQLPANAFDQRLLNTDGIHGKVEITIRSAFLQGLLLLNKKSAISRLPIAGNALQKWYQWYATREVTAVSAAFSLVKGMQPDYVVVGVDDLGQLIETIHAWEHAEPMLAPELATTNNLIFDPRLWPLLENG